MCWSAGVAEVFGYGSGVAGGFEESSQWKSISSRSLRVLFYQASLPLPSLALNRVAAVVRSHRCVLESRWRVLTPGRQALMTLVYLWKGDTYADVAAGFGGTVATSLHRVNDTIHLLTAKAVSLPAALR